MKPWIEEEISVLTEYWHKAYMPELLILLPERTKQSILHKGKSLGLGSREAFRNLSHFPKIRRKISKSVKEWCREHGGMTKGKRLSEEHKIKVRETSKAYWANPYNKAKRSIKLRELWQNPDYVRKVIKGEHKRPTSLEQRLISILDKELPYFKYNGDFSQGVTLAGMVPDFININGKKQVIEAFGDYWHSGEGIPWRKTDLGRIMAYNSLGFDCLILKESELKRITDIEIAGIIKKFFRKRN